MHVRLILALGALFLVLSCNVAQAQQWSPQKTLVVDLKAKEIMKAPKGPPSVAIGVSINGVQQMANGYGMADASKGQSATALTQYQIGSLTKQLTAAAVLDMTGPTRRVSPRIPVLAVTQLSLGGALDTYLPEAKGWMPKGKVTLQHLLNMQSGFTNFTSLNPAGTGMPNTKATIPEPAMMDFINLMMQVRPQQFAPGSQYDYSNTNYFLLAQVAQRAAKSDFHTVLKSRVFDRAGMTNTGFLGSFPQTGSVASAPYDTAGSDWNKPSWPKGAGDVVTNVPDLLKWHAGLMGGKVLMGDRMKEMFKPVATVDAAKGIKYAMGWFVMSAGDYDWYYHGGSIAGFSSFDSILLNTKTGVWTSSVVLTNQDNVKLDKVSACLVQLAMDNATEVAKLGPVAVGFCQGL